MPKPGARLFVRIGCVVILILLGLLMYIVGKQHNVYFDNKDFEGYKAFRSVEVTLDKQEPLELMKRDRDVQTVTNQVHKISIVTVNGEEVELKVKFPIKWQNILINVPALVAGEPESVWMSEFVMDDASYDDSEEVVTDDTAGLLGE